MITTADEALAARLRRLRAHGLGRDGAYHEPSGNARLSDLHAAVGRVQLARLPAALAERRRLAADFDPALAGHPGLAPPPPRPGALTNVQSYPARVRRGDAESVLAHFSAHGVGARGGLTNAHETPAFRTLLASGRARIGEGGLPVSERLRRETVLLPLF